MVCGGQAGWGGRKRWKEEEEGREGRKRRKEGKEEKRRKEEKEGREGRKRRKEKEEGRWRGQTFSMVCGGGGQAGWVEKEEGRGWSERERKVEWG